MARPGGHEGRGLVAGVRPRLLAAVERAAVAGCALLLAALAWRTGTAIGVAGGVWTAAAVVLGVCAADFASGLAHWAGDTFLSEDAPLVGRRVIAPFREHHRDPLAITRHGLAERTGNSAVILLPLAAAVWWQGVAATAWGVLAHVAFVAFALALALTNEIHAWAHAPRVPCVVRWLQRAGLVLDPAAHDRHHRDGFRRAYCITTGWLNAPLDRLRVWARLERVIRRGDPVSSPHRAQPDEDSTPQLAALGRPPRGRRMGPVRASD